MLNARFFIDHGAIHDRATGKHVSTKPDDGFEDGITACCALLNELESQLEVAVRLEQTWAEACKAKAALADLQTGALLANEVHLTWGLSAFAATGGPAPHYLIRLEQTWAEACKAKAALADLQTGALLANEVHLTWGLSAFAATGGPAPHYLIEAHNMTSDALTAAGFPDRASRDAERARRAGR